jgi:thiol-disulfide isomerase/thioredoxin
VSFRTHHLGTEGRMPSLAGATTWLNSPPLTPEGLRGSVVLVQFWTYTCVNWLRTLPYVRAWADRYGERGLVVLGVHTPEFPFEHDLVNVRRAAEELDVTYPVAVDNDYAVWNAFANHYWPALYVVDDRGRIRHHRFGEGDYELSERVVQQLLTEAGAGDSWPEPVDVSTDGVTTAADWDDLESGENYVGYERTQGFASPDGAVPEQRHLYAAPDRLRRNEWALTGDWTLRPGAAVLNEPTGGISYRFHARDLNLVMAPPEKPVRFRIRVDGQPPGDAHGSDVDAQGEGLADEPRLYQLVRQPGGVTDRQFDIEFLEPGVAAYSFTFG